MPPPPPVSPWPPPPPPGWAGPPAYAPPYGPTPAAATNQLCLASLVLGVTALVTSFCCIFFGAPLGIAAIVTGIIGLTQVGSDPGSSKAQGIAGIACGVGGLILPLVMVLFFTLPTTFA